MDELDKKNQIIQKFQSLKIKKKSCEREEDSFKKPFDKKKFVQ